MVSSYKGNCGVILHGNDTDVTYRTIVKFTPDAFVVTDVMVDETSDIITEGLFASVKIWTKADLMKEYELQLGTPMMYLHEKELKELLEDDVPAKEL